MKPPTGGPSTGAINPGQVIVDMARIISGFGVERITTMRPTGVIIEAPMPCRMRAPTKGQKLVAMPHSTEATVKIAMAPAKTVRAP